MSRVSSWGRLSNASHSTVQLAWRPAEGPLYLAGRPGIAHGMGRSYGDASLNPGGTLWMTTGLSRFIAFDTVQGTITCEAGVLLRDIQRIAVPRGWMLPVTPGTQLVTVGGAIANDVHGKNHHAAGSFGDHVRELLLQRTDGEMISCGPSQNNEWFRATVGGIGLTGLILTATLQLRCVEGPWLETQTIPYESLDAFFRLSDESESTWEHTVSWVDCLTGNGRGLFMRANHSSTRSGPLPPPRAQSVPFVPPVSMINPLSLRLFNTAYFHLGQRKSGTQIAHYQPFFYPLDHLQNWNRIYGPRGFFQYQCSVPRKDGEATIGALLKAIAREGSGSFLAVLKTFGERTSHGMLGFPRPGVTLALDFPNHGKRTETLFRSLDAIVAEAGGHMYLAKDARMPAELFRSGYPNIQEFCRYRDPGMASAMSRRLLDN